MSRPCDTGYCIPDKCTDRDCLSLTPSFPVLENKKDKVMSDSHRQTTNRRIYAQVSQPHERICPHPKVH